MIERDHDKTISTFTDELGNCYVTTEDARRLIQKATASRWHDVEKNPCDIPEHGRPYEAVIRLSEGSTTQIHQVYDNLPIGCIRWAYTPIWSEKYDG